MDHLFCVLVRRKHRIKNVLDDAITADERQPASPWQRGRAGESMKENTYHEEQGRERNGSTGQ